MATKFVNVAYGNRKIPKRMTFNHKVVSNTYEVRMEGQPEYLLIYRQPEDGSILLDDTVPRKVKSGMWLAAVVSPGSRHLNIMAYSFTPKDAYVDAVECVW